ncbi:uncharacterized protein LOC106143451 isoform X2 [Amyelois transitella]|uniref:uncharacterized protein LOC106143451 isoform X2 n=2 Tax=Amyelois transitella TaxID=680683 RepID=UPI00298FE545|nr:uncharacterized protein LOC106143451 isoform X2 [Amyelois transitella]
MVIKVGINGFGRIGRVIFRTCHQNPDLEVAAINDPAIDVEYICYLIKFDSTHGKFRGSIIHTESEITVDDAKIKIFHEKLPANVPWQSAEVQYVVEASGIFTSLQKASGHLASESVKRVIVTAPSADVPMVILGVNHSDLDSDKRVISSASSTLYCLAPIVKILNDNFGVSEGFLTSIHAMTPSLKPLDGLCLRGKHWRDHRSIHQNIIPAATGACKALGKIIPQVKDKLVGLAFRVPIVNVSVLDLTLRLNKETSLQEIANAVEKYSKSTMQNIVKISNEDAVSSDFAGDEHSCIIDVDSSLQLKKNSFKLVCWYENEFSYACRVIDLILFSERQFLLPDPRNIMNFATKRTAIKKQNDKAEDKNNEIKSDLSHSSSQLVHCRSPGRPVKLRKPASISYSGNSQETTANSDAIFRIWNDDNETNKRVKAQSSSCHKCDEATPHTSQIHSVKAHQRLENVKKEFSKMVSITESLLSKCNKIRDISLSENALEEKAREKKICDIDNKKSFDGNIIKESPTFNLISDISGDYMSNIEEINSSKNNFRRDNLSDYNKKSSAFISTNQTDSDSLKLKVSGNSADFSQFSNDVKTSCLKKKKVDHLFQDQVVQTITNLINGLAQNIELNFIGKPHTDDVTCDGHKVDEYKDNNKTQFLKKSPENIDDSGFVSPVKNRTSQACVFNDEIILSKLEEKSQVEVEIKSLDLTSSDNATAPGKCIRTASDDQSPKVSHSKSTTNTDCFTATKSFDKPNKSLEIPAEILNNLNRLLTDPVIIVPDSSKCASSTLTASGNSETGRKVDLYDKLDSVSASDSDNSFQIHERKSQVINIADLTNSIEDLVRLDKICRIIEISDELSDKLFSTLGSTDSAAIQKTKWSFKDLCQRIKLDEFCNKLFSGQSCHCDKKN